MPEPVSGVRVTLRSLPSVDDLLQAHPPEKYRITRKQARAVVRTAIETTRQALLDGQSIDDPVAEIKTAVSRQLEQLARSALRPVINGTGVVLHTGLGRAPLGNAVLDRVFCSLGGYASLELDLASGKRGERLGIVAELFKALTPSEGVVVVNNNAAAVLLMINTVADGKEIIVSRGQQVEIGGSFRMPEVIGKAQARMVEVGTTNRTHLIDYENAISRETAALLYVHTSNYRVEGFTREVQVSDLAALAQRKRLPLLVDLGSGSLSDHPVPGVAGEPSIAGMLKAGVTLVSFSGDKLLGGPQAGIILGRNKWLKQLHRNPLYRALRCDKVILGLLEQTLRTYVDPGTYSAENLALTLLNRDRPELRAQAEDLLSRLAPEGLTGGAIKIVDSSVEAGSGSLPQVPLPSVALAITKDDATSSELAEQFRRASCPVVGYVRRGRYYIDLKAIPIEKNDLLARSIEEVLGPGSSGPEQE